MRQNCLSRSSWEPDFDQMGDVLIQSSLLFEVFLSIHFICLKCSLVYILNSKGYIPIVKNQKGTFFKEQEDFESNSFIHILSIPLPLP